MAKGNCEFNGTGGQFFVTVVIHLFLISMITFGIYSPWAWVRVFKLKATHTLIDGKKVSFTGKGLRLFLLVLVQGILTVVTLGLYGPWAICRFLHWKAEHTLVGDKPSQFTGTGASLFIFYIINLMILPMITLGLYFFIGFYRFYAWKEEHTKYGGEKTSFGAGLGDFVKVVLISWILNTVTFNLFSPWALCMLYRWQVSGLVVGDAPEVRHHPPVKVKPLIVIILVLIGLIPFILIISLFLIFGHKVMTLPIEPTQVQRTEQTGHKFTGAIKHPVRQSTQKIGQKQPKRAKALPTMSQNKQTVIKPLATASVIKKRETRPLDYDREIEKLTDLIKKDRRNADAFYDRANLQALKGDQKSALQDYTQSIRIKRDHADAFYNRGLIYVEMGNYDQAVKDFSAVIRLAPKSVDAYCNRGSAYYQLGEYNLAVKDYAAALEINPDDADVYQNRSLVYLSLGEKDKSMADSEKATQLMKRQEAEAGKKTTANADAAPNSSGTMGVNWRDDLKDAVIPNEGAKGMIHSESFVPVSAEIEQGILTIRDGQDFFPDHAVVIFLFLDDGETAEGKSFDITKQTGFGAAPHVHVKWKPENRSAVESEIFIKDYVMRLEFGTARSGKLPGKIYLCLPDKTKSFLAGSFEADIK